VRRSSIQCGHEFEVILLPGPDQPVVRRSSIIFNEKVRVKTMQPDQTLVPEPGRLWFQEMEYKSIRGRRSLDLANRPRATRQGGNVDVVGGHGGIRTSTNSKTKFIRKCVLLALKTKDDADCCLRGFLDRIVNHDNNASMSLGRLGRAGNSTIFRSF
jgi:hypothetical protein